MTRDGLDITFHDAGIRIEVKEQRDNGHFILWDDLDEMRRYSEELNARKE